MIRKMIEDASRYLKELRELENEHRDLNEIIDNPSSRGEFSEFTLQKLKKRKLLVKDHIKRLKGFLHPDIIA